MVRPQTSSPHLIPTGLTFSSLLSAAFLYPLRGAALVALVVLAPMHELARSLLGGIGSSIILASVIFYAMECLRRTANGYADPPEVTLHSSYVPVLLMLLLQMLNLFGLVLAPYQPLFWLLVLTLTALSPVIATALAFGDGLGAALNPLRWNKAIAAFGLAYLLPMAMNVFENLAYISYLHHPEWPGRLVWITLVIYLYLLQFHVLGALMYRYHSDLGHNPEVNTLAVASGRDDDDILLQRADALHLRGQHAEAELMLRERLHALYPSTRLFNAHRNLLRQCGDNKRLLTYAQEHLALLMSEEKLRPALSLVLECIELNPQFMPSQPKIAAQLADAATAQGMKQLALKLARGYPNTWPHDERAAYYGLLAARLLAEYPDRTAEACVLTGKLLRAYPKCPQRVEIEAFMHAQNPGKSSP